MQRRPRTLLHFAAPGRQQRGVQSFPSEKGTDLPRLFAPLGLPNDSELVLHRELAPLGFRRNLRIRDLSGQVGRDGASSVTPVALRAPSVTEESSTCVSMGEGIIRLHSSALYIKLNGSPCLTHVVTEGNPAS